MDRRMILAAAIIVAGATRQLPPAALAQVTGGLWEIQGAPGAQRPVRQCIADVLVLAQFEHRNRNCSRKVLTDRESRTVINYSCGASDFGESQIDVITPRSLRISTQGISAEMPFNYVLQAHRIGDCTSSAAHH